MGIRHSFFAGMVPARTSFTLLCCAAPLIGCGDDARHSDRDAGVPQSGSLELSWTIGGETRAADCTRIGAEALEASVFDQGWFVGELEAPCEDFTVDVDLVVDDYVVRMLLVDELDLPASDRIVFDRVVIREDRTTTLEVDFPANGFEADGGT